MKWLCRKVYTLEKEVDGEGNSTYKRGEFSHIEVLHQTNGGLPRGSDEAYEHILVDGVSARFPRVSDVATDGPAVWRVIEDTAKKEEDDLEEIYLKRINKAPMMKAKLAAAVSKLPDNSGVPGSPALITIQYLLESGSWTELVGVIPTLTDIPKKIRTKIAKALQKHLDSES